jgi:hypothetical protein
MVERLVEKLAGSVPSWGARVAYGEKSTVGGQDIVPVAIVAFGFGAGEGTGETPASERLPQGKGEGSGGGGGGIALPIGAYVQGPSGAVFKPNAIALVLAATPIVMSVAAAIAGVYAMRSAVKVGSRFAGVAEHFAAPPRIFGARRSGSKLSPGRILDRAVLGR